jgi:hypothetical protein
MTRRALALFFKNVDPYVIDWYLRKLNDACCVAQVYCIYNKFTPIASDKKYQSFVQFVHDSEIVDESLFSRRDIDRAGWYRQQLIKIAFAISRIDSHDEVLIVDGDTLLSSLSVDMTNPLIAKSEPLSYLVTTTKYLDFNSSKAASNLLRHKLSPIVNYGIWNTRLIANAIKNIQCNSFSEWADRLLSCIEIDAKKTRGPVFSEYLWYSSQELASGKRWDEFDAPTVFRRAGQVFGLNKEKLVRQSILPFDVVAFECDSSHRNGTAIEFASFFMWHLRTQWK